jgi:plasmid stability protein
MASDVLDRLQIRAAALRMSLEANPHESLTFQPAAIEMMADLFELAVAEIRRLRERVGHGGVD